MADVLTEMVDGLRRLRADITAEELAEVLWLCEQGAPLAGRAVDAPADAPVPAPPARRRDRRGVEHGGQLSQEAGPSAPSQVHLPERRPGAEPAPVSASQIRLPDVTALSHARELSRALGPLRYDVKRHPGHRIDEDATARRIAQTGIRVPVWQSTRRRRLDLDLVLDLGGSGPLWKQLAAELGTMLQIHGAFRSVRSWVLDSDSPELTLRRSRGGATRYSWGAICQAPRRPLVIVLTDGTGRTWRTKAAHRPLLNWARYGKVLLVQLLPAEMWHRTAMRALPVTFVPANDSYHRGARLEVDDAELSIIGLDRDALPRATAIPVIGLDARWFRSWLPLLRGTEAGAVPGYALLISPPGDRPPGEPEIEPAEVRLTAEQRVQRFSLTASPDARRLARLLSVGPFNLAVMRKIQHDLLPGSKPTAIAEVMLGGLVYWETPVGTSTPAGAMTFRFHDGVRELLRERPGGVAEFRRDKERVQEALLSGPNGGPSYSGILAASAPASETGLAEEDAEPLLTLPERHAASTQPVPDAGKRGAVPRPAQPQDQPLRIGIWGSTQSGRTTFLSVLQYIGWASGRGGVQWSVVPGDAETEFLVDERIKYLTAERTFPEATIKPELLSFQLVRRRPRGRGPVGWLRRERVAQITMALQDRQGGDYVGDRRQENASRYLENSDVLLYFFDPLYDIDNPKWHSLDFFTAVEAHLAMSAARGDLLHGRYLPQHIAVCIPKLDDQAVFDIARKHGCVETEPATGRPWVPERHARHLFEAICRGQKTFEADFLRTRLRRSFHPERISYHALSSVGFWIPPGGELDPRDVCNVIELPQAADDSNPPPRRVRGEIRPVHVLDPLIRLVERAGIRGWR